jgi:hypothetical protein
MVRLTRLVLVATAVMIAVLCPLGLVAQRKSAPVNASQAPVPTLVLQAKTAFISFELGDTASFPGFYSGGPERAYDEFYQGMQQWGRYQLVSDPKDADIVFAIRYVDSGPYLRLQITDPHNGISLWGFEEQIKSTGFKKTRDAGFDTAVVQVVNDVRQLVEPNGPPVPAQH